MRYKHCNFDCDRSILKGTLLGEQSTFSAECQLPSKGLSWNVLPRNFHACATHTVCLVSSAIKEGDFTCRMQFLLSCNSAAIQEISVKLRTPYFTSMPYIRCKARAIGRWLKVPFLNYNVLFSLYLGCSSRNSPETPHFRLSIPTPLTVELWRSVKN